MALGDRYIVGEVSKGWIHGLEVQPTGPISVSFEKLVNHNLTRGYKLHSFQLHQSYPSRDELVETIIAVFEKE